MGILDNLSDAFNNGMDSANRMANVAGYKLKLESAKRTRHDALAELGEKVLDAVRANPSQFPDVAPQIEAIDAADREIADLQARIEREQGTAAKTSAAAANTPGATASTPGVATNASDTAAGISDAAASTTSTVEDASGATAVAKGAEGERTDE